jgi:hypothetical protein
MSRVSMLAPLNVWMSCRKSPVPMKRVRLTRGV